MSKQTKSEYKTILCVGAHPDDIDFSVSGTVAKFVASGAQVYYIVATDGSRGSSDPQMTYKRLAAIRKKEQLEASKTLGVKKVFFLNREDTRLVADFELKQDISRVIRLVKPDLIITIDPTFYYSTEAGFINHTDHRAVGEATMDAFFPMSRDRMTFPKLIKEGVNPHVCHEIWFIGFTNGNKKIDVTSTIDKKFETMKCHQSQFKDFENVKRFVEILAVGKGKNKKYFEYFNAVKLGW